MRKNRTSDRFRTSVRFSDRTQLEDDNGARPQLPIVSSQSGNVQHQRQCGECQACCVVFTVPEVEKGRHERCRHQCEMGCGIYSERPDICRNFVCEWLCNNTWPEDLRPDKSGIIFVCQGMMERAPYKIYLGTQAHPYSYLSGQNRRWIDRLKYAGHVVFVAFSDSEGQETNLFASEMRYPGLTAEQVGKFVLDVNKQYAAKNAAFYRSRKGPVR